jgi:hypothetical protein
MMMDEAGLVFSEKAPLASEMVDMLVFSQKIVAPGSDRVSAFSVRSVILPFT